MPHPLQVVSEIRIAKPCAVSWRSMRGDGRKRHCTHCDLDVYNISRLSADEAARLIRDNTDGLCVRIYRRRDGTVMTRDCPAPLAGSKWSWATWAAWLAAIFGALCASCRDDSPGTPPLQGQMSQNQNNYQPTHCMGAIFPPSAHPVQQTTPATHPAIDPARASPIGP